MPLASCTLLFSPESKSVPDDGGVPDASVPDATAPDATVPDAQDFVEYSYDFEDGLPPVWENHGCTASEDPMDATNKVICCETIPGGDAAFSLSLEGLGIAPRKHAEIDFRVLSVVGPEGPIMSAFSPLAGATDGLFFDEDLVVVNMNLYPDNTIEIVSSNSGVFSRGDEKAFRTNEWSQATMIASTETGCSLSAKINSEELMDVQGKHDRGDFEEVIFGIFRQPNNITSTVHRCFDDIEIRFPTECSLP